MLKNAIMDVICKYLYFNKLQKKQKKRCLVGLQKGVNKVAKGRL